MAAMAEYELSFEELRLQVMGLYTCPTDIESNDEVQEVVADLNVDNVGCPGGDLDLELQGNSREDPRKRILDQSSETDATEDESTSGSEPDISSSTSKLSVSPRRVTSAVESKDDHLKPELKATNFGCPDDLFLPVPKDHVFPRPRADSFDQNCDRLEMSYLKEDLRRRIREQKRIQERRRMFYDNPIALTDHFRERLVKRGMDSSNLYDCIVHGTKERDGSNWRFSHKGVSVITDGFVRVAITIFRFNDCDWM